MRIAVLHLATLAALGCLAELASAQNGRLLHIVAEGTAFEVGEKVGREAKAIIASRLAEPAVQEIIDWMATSQEALEVNRSLYEMTRSVLPEALDEMQGIARGAEQSFAAIWFLNIHVEIQTLQGQLWPTNGSSSGGAFSQLLDRTPHCTDVFAALGSRTRVWGHNEDGSLNDQNHTYLVTVRVHDASGVVIDNYTSFAYAGSLGGGSFAFNQHGIIFTDNSLFPNNSNYVDSFVLPQRILHRVAFRQRTVGDVAHTLAAFKTSTAFSYNVGTWDGMFERGGLSFINVETDPMGAIGLKRVDPPTYPMGGRGPRRATPAPTEAPLPEESRHMYHCNEYLTLTTPQSLDPSSEARVARLVQMGTPASPYDIRQRLGDTQNPLFPIYRTYRNSDPVVTLATAVFDLSERTVSVFTKNPKVASPDYVFTYRPY